MTKTRELGTRADSAYARLRADILTGRVEPGARLKSAELCQRYDTSVGATREALSRLAAEGLVRGVPHVGYTVTPLSEEDLIELTQARVEIETLVLGLSIEAGGLEWEGQALAAFHVLERTPFKDTDDPARPSDEWARVHTEFHNTLLAACPNSRLLRLARTLRVEAGLYQLWSVSFQREPARDGLGEHRAIVEASIARDIPAAKALLADHLQHTTRLLLDD
jgi:DNA-binding GntR family transcriptional regulator